MSAARFLLQQLIIGSFLGAAYFGFAGLAGWTAAGVLAGLLFVTAMVGMGVWELQRHAHVEATGELRADPSAG